MLFFWRVRFQSCMLMTWLGEARSRLIFFFLWFFFFFFALCPHKFVESTWGAINKSAFRTKILLWSADQYWILSWDRFKCSFEMSSSFVYFSHPYISIVCLSRSKSSSGAKKAPISTENHMIIAWLKSHTSSHSQIGWPHVDFTAKSHFLLPVHPILSVYPGLSL